MILPIMALAATASAQDARDISKTEIFLTPYSEMGDGQEHYPRINGRVLALTGYTHYFGIRDDNGQIPRSDWSSTQPQIEGAFVLQLTKRLSVRTKARSEEHTSELQSLMRTSYAAFCLKKKKTHKNTLQITHM